jgi:copper chaperone CopZ
VPTQRPIALIYRSDNEQMTCDGCAEAIGDELANTAGAAGYRVFYCGPGEPVTLTAATLATASLYVQPGGGDDLARAWLEMQPHRRVGDVDRGLGSGLRGSHDHRRLGRYPAADLLLDLVAARAVKLGAG